MIILTPFIAELVPAIAGAMVAGVGYVGYRVQDAHRPVRSKPEPRQGRVHYKAISGS